jgi:hypothetical protein
MNKLLYYYKTQQDGSYKKIALITFYFIIAHFSNISNMNSKLPLFYHETVDQPLVFNY